MAKAEVNPLSVKATIERLTTELADVTSALGDARDHVAELTGAFGYVDEDLKSLLELVRAEHERHNQPWPICARPLCRRAIGLGQR